MPSDTLKILYVDDDRDIREIVALSLALDPMIELRAYPCGVDALEMLARDEWRPQLMLLDVMMPKMDGRALIENLRAVPGLETVPFAFITARARLADIDAYKANGAADVIVKPFEPLELAPRLRAISHMREA